MPLDDDMNFDAGLTPPMLLALCLVIWAALVVVQRGPRWARLLARRLNHRGARLRAGCIPVRVRPSGQLDVLLVRSRNHPEVFTLPGGGVEGGESTQEAALREVHEEAGLKGRLGRCMGELYNKENRSHTTMYALHVEEELSVYDESSRERRWFSLGVPGSPRAGSAFDAVRAQLSPKRVHQHFFDRLVEEASQLMRDGEAAEQSARECRTASRGNAWPRRRRPGAKAS